MLSVILYGRNDSHGYNLHKRAAISLNAIAYLLSDPADEIIFVDYNTPDDLPTFPEAIADTLTAKAIEKLRILRVRPGIHNERFAAKTHLAALEPIARNVAIRRTNPANKWVLSTNTDMIFVPRHDGQDLTAAIGALKDGFYHLPRFELPEGLWETLDRKDPEGLINGAREWGQRFHLNEIILSGNDNLYDGPGDFQLFLRDDLFEIGGFHEEMIRGWHLDANVAKRMRILRGEVSTALPALIGYHCDHTRQATAYHKGDRVENSSAIFVDNIFEPQVRDQMTSWGMPEVDIEELKLGQASGARYLRALEAAVPGRLEGFLQAEYVPEAYGRLDYDPSHVLPYLLDLVSCLPVDTRIGYVGARSDMFQAFSKAWAAMGVSKAIAVPDIAPWLVEGDSTPFEQWLDECDLFIFEVGAEQAVDQTQLSDEERSRLWAVDYSFKLAAQCDRERQTAGAAPRRTLIVNAIHNFFEPQVFGAISVTLTPFSTRIRHGYFTNPDLQAHKATDEAGRASARLLAARQPLSMPERALLANLTSDLNLSYDDAAFASAGRQAAEIASLVEAKAPEFALLSDRAFQRIMAGRPSQTIKKFSHLIAPEAGAGASSRLARLEDWEDNAWLKLARLLFAHRPHHRLNERDRWVWERVTLAQNLHQSQVGGSVLLVGVLPEAFAYALAAMDYEVDIASPRSLADGGRDAVDWRRELAEEAWMHRKPVGLASDRLADFKWDAVIFCQNSLFANGRAGAAQILQNTLPHIRTGGHLGFSARVQLGDDATGANPESLGPNLVRGGLILQALRDLAGLTPEGGADMTLTPRTADRFAAIEYPPGEPPALVIGSPSEMETTGVFALSVGDGQDDADWLGLEAAITRDAYVPRNGPATGQARSSLKSPVGDRAATADVSPMAGGKFFTSLEVTELKPRLGRRTQAHFGTIADRMLAQEGIRRDVMALHIPADIGEELAAMADIGELPEGDYELYLEGRINQLSRPGNFLVMGLASSRGLVSEHAEAATSAGPFKLAVPFTIDRDTAGSPDGIRLGFKGTGLAAVSITELILR